MKIYKNFKIEKKFQNSAIAIGNFDGFHLGHQKVINQGKLIAKKYNLNFAQMSVKFCEIQPFMTSVIIGATTMEQLKENIESVNINLTKELIKDLNEIQKIYPNPCP